MLQFGNAAKCYEYPDGQGNTLHGDPLDINERMEIFANGDIPSVIYQAFPRPEPAIVATYDEQGNVTGQGPKLDANGQPEMWRPTPTMEERDRFYAMVRHGFGIEPFDPSTGKGYTKEMLRKLWVDFDEWMDSKKNVPDGLPTSVAPTEQESSAPSEKLAA